LLNFDIELYNDKKSPEKSSKKIEKIDKDGAFFSFKKPKSESKSNSNGDMIISNNHSVKKPAHTNIDIEIQS
jgi:hypothetical protein